MVRRDVILQKVRDLGNLMCWLVGKASVIVGAAVLGAVPFVVLYRLFGVNLPLEVALVFGGVTVIGVYAAAVRGIWGNHTSS